MKALVPAAGRGARMGALAHNAHKGLLRVADKAILEHLVSVLRDFGVDEIVVVTGHRADQVRSVLGDSVTYVHNPHYATEGVLRTLEVAASQVQGSPFLLAMADHIYSADMVERSLASGMDLVVAIEEIADYERSDVRIRVDGGRILEWGKDLSIEAATHQFAGIVRFSARASEGYYREVAAMLAGQKPGRLAFDAVASLSRDPVITLDLLVVHPGSRFEVDTVADLRAARTALDS